MALKPRSAKNHPMLRQLRSLTNWLISNMGAAPIVKTGKTVQRSLALPLSLDQAITRVSAENKLSGSGPKNTSAVIREALEQYLERRNSDN
jgi:hypothetical protein